MVITIGHLMSSLETRPSAKAYKISMRIESINVEASVEYSLIPIIDTCAMRGKYFVIKFKINYCICVFTRKFIKIFFEY